MFRVDMVKTPRGYGDAIMQMSRGVHKMMAKTKAPQAKQESPVRPSAKVQPKRPTNPARQPSRVSGYFKRSVEERVQLLVEQGRITPEDAQMLGEEASSFPLSVADSMVENVIGVYGLPMSLGLNFVVNGRDYVVPMVVEEPSVVAAVSHTARIVRDSGGFEADSDPSLMIGQVQVVGCEDPHASAQALRDAADELLKTANALQPNLVARGGGARRVEVRVVGGESRYTAMVVLHLIIDTCDAMGANLINTMAEGVAPMVERISGGRVHLRILSNLADQRMVRAVCRIPFKALAWRGFDGEEVARGVALASEFAELDPYRAATHNKGVMNGIDAVALATGNDWRAIEAGAHAYCALGQGYKPMAVWWVEGGALCGKLELPLQVGIVGGPIRLHPMLKIAYKLLGVESAAELAEVMGAVGLAQNLAALKALATEGIQRGHMSLHARSVAATAGAEGDEVERVADMMILEGEIKVHRARQLLHGLRA